ncbi:hypothetical protein IQ226_12900 [Dolichospermum sp. LEGE 00240]|uniref:COP23 domain-containing protein n=1 Tax=Dolichospermum sp. LEGE 00240 TaxID=1828603 RepID=UPI00187F4837|nr:COP23 domain-containing protein [Dolichospermum sp. LEGE 00240]MBE9250037.1 hypothetical protein [Dolichospermum sp. LEGE 00240]MDM3856447.1 COP23 domain-containing protein [Aphanizomenon gracile PMC649.10]MDM3863040.1 COP23 domain-containing protein [Aphanizomenon gracile PMC644.10]
MKLQSLSTFLGLTTLTLTMSINPGLSQDNASENQPNQVTFFCQEIFDQASGEKVPATIAWVPERQGHVRFIGWKSEYFAKGSWTPQKRCQEVSKKFHNFYEAGRLNRLTTGKNKGYSVVCAVASNEQTCNGNNQLFTLKNNSNPGLVLEQLVNIAQGKSSEPLWQNSGNRKYLNVGKYLQNAPLVNIKK